MKIPDDKEFLKLCDDLRNTYGVDHQLVVALEELAELQKEITKELRCQGNNSRLEEEFADVLVVMGQLAYYLDLDEKSIELHKRFKIQRVLIKEAQNDRS